MLRSVFLFLLSLFKSQTQLHLEVLFLRKQLEIVARSTPRLKMKPADRFFLDFLTDLFDSWKAALLIVKLETLIRWHRQNFRIFWKWKERVDGLAGQRSLKTQINLIKQMASENPLWGAPRIHGELLKLGLISRSLLSSGICRRNAPKTTKQRWKTFLTNNSSQIVSVDFLVVPLSPSGFLRSGLPITRQAKNHPHQRYFLIPPLSGVRTNCGTLSAIMNRRDFFCGTAMRSSES